MANLQDFLSIINGASTAELSEFYNILKQRLTVSFRVGNKVQFDAGYRGVIKGIVTKINQKSIGILADSGMRWKVPPTSLTKL